MRRLRARLDAEISAEERLCERLLGVDVDQVDVELALLEDLRAIARLLDTPLLALVAPDRRPAIARRRHVAAWLLQQSGWSVSAIGRGLRRDRTTVLHSIRVVDHDPQLVAAAHRLQGRLETR